MKNHVLYVVIAIVLFVCIGMNQWFISSENSRLKGEVSKQKTQISKYEKEFGAPVEQIDRVGKVTYTLPWDDNWYSSPCLFKAETGVVGERDKIIGKTYLTAEKELVVWDNGDKEFQNAMKSELKGYEKVTTSSSHINLNGEIQVWKYEIFRKDDKVYAFADSNNHYVEIRYQSRDAVNTKENIEETIEDVCSSLWWEESAKDEYREAK